MTFEQARERAASNGILISDEMFLDMKYYCLRKVRYNGLPGSCAELAMLDELNQLAVDRRHGKPEPDYEKKWQALHDEYYPTAAHRAPRHTAAKQAGCMLLAGLPLMLAIVAAMIISA